MDKLKLRYPALLLAALLAVGLTGCNEQSQATAQLGQPKVSVQETVKEDIATTTAETVELAETVWLTGSLAADEQSDVAAKRGGIVREVLVDRGSIVKEADVLVRLDTTDAVNTLEQSEAKATELLVRLGLSSTEEKFNPANQPDVKAAKAALDLATQNFERDKALIESKVIAPGEFDKTRSEYNTARQNYDLAVASANQLYRQFQTALTQVKTSRQLLIDMNVKAPFDGAIVEKMTAPGESLSEGARVVSMVRINPLRLLLNVPEQDVGLIREGQSVRFQVDAFPGEVFKGTVSRISPALDPETRTLVVEAEVPNKDRILKPGLFATAQVQLEADRKGVIVPATAVRSKGDASMVYVVDEGVTRAVMVVAGENRKGLVEIVNGLKGGETVVSNAAEVEDGVRIQ